MWVGWQTGGETKAKILQTKTKSTEFLNTIARFESKHESCESDEDTFLIYSTYLILMNVSLLI